MLCEKCRQKEATVHFTHIEQGKLTRQSFCDECGERAQEAFTQSLRENWRPRPTVAGIAKGDSRYEPMAYKFLIEALGYAEKMKGKPRRQSSNAGVTAKELVEVLRMLATLRYGYEAKRHFKRWGINRGEDFREIFCILVASGLLSYGGSFSCEEYLDGCNFNEAFPGN